MKINRALNLAIEVQSSDRAIHFHSVPISRETFKSFCLVLSKVFAQIYNEGLSVVAGPSIAAIMLEQVAKETPRAKMKDDDSGDWWGGSYGVKDGLMREIKRLTNVIVMDGQWKALPVEMALSQGFIEDADWEEVEGQIVFFILASAMHSRKDLPGILMGMSAMWGGQITSSNCTDFAASLQELTQEKNITGTPSSIAS